MHPLDNVIWQALTTRQTQFAEISGAARRFQPDVTALCAFENPERPDFASLAGLIDEHRTGAIFIDEPYENHPGWEFVAGAPLGQMVCENGRFAPAHADSATEILDLGPTDSAEMLELAELTRPGPFGTRTHELGAYVGVRSGGKLVSMAGERMKVPGYTEVSAVCTHPDHTGRGYAAVLMSEIMRRIRERGETPFLHVRSDNTRAIAVYDRLGFRTRKQMHFAVLRRVRSE